MMIRAFNVGLVFQVINVRHNSMGDLLILRECQGDTFNYSTHCHLFVVGFFFTKGSENNYTYKVLPYLSVKYYDDCSESLLKDGTL